MNTYLSERDILYSPDRWSKRFAANIILEKHLDIIGQYSETVRKEIPCDLNISYGPSQREVMHIYGTDLANESPIFIHIHGGYWKEEAVTPSNNSFIAKWLYKNQIKSIFIGYEVCPKVSIQEILNNIGIAIIKCLDYAKKHKSRKIYLSGHSCGAHLVATLFVTFIPSLSADDQQLLKAAFLICGLYDLVPLIQTHVNQILDLDEDSAKDASPIYHNLSGGILFYIIIAQHDSPVFSKQATEFNTYLSRLGLLSKVVLIEHVDHYEIIERLIEENFELTQLFIKAIKES